MEPQDGDVVVGGPGVNGETGVAGEGVGAALGGGLCEYSLCQLPVPDTPTGRKRQYCVEPRWRRRSDGKLVGCDQLGRGEKLHRDVHGDDAVPDVTLVELRRSVDEASGPVAALSTLLLAVQEQLATVVTEARVERGEALRQAAADAGARQVAEEVATASQEDARAARAELEEGRTKVTAANAAVALANAQRDGALLERSGLIAERDGARKEAELQAEAAEEARSAAEELKGKLTVVTTQLQATKDALERAEQAAADEQQRAEAAIREAREDASRSRTAAQDAGIQLTSALERVTALEEQLVDVTERHGTAVSDLREQLGRLEEQRDRLQAEQDRAVATANGWRARLAQAVGQAVPAKGQDPTRTVALSLLAGADAGGS